MRQRKGNFLIGIILFIFCTVNVHAQLVTGIDTVSIINGQWEYFDFTAGTSFGIEDTATYTPDFRGSSNEGVNFGREFSPLIPLRRLYLLGTGTIDTVSTVPLWTDAAPWVNTSWDFSHGTQGQPVTAGQLWVVYTSEGMYAVLEITALPNGASGDSFVFKYKYMGEGGNTFPVDVQPEQLAGSATLSSFQGFDFSTQVRADNEDGFEYEVDVAFVSNEGVNFGNEGSSSLSGTGRRFLLLGEGSIDTVKTVPLRQDTSPWVTVSYDFSDGTGGQPISTGQLWAVYTREGNYAVMAITGLPNGDFGSSFTFDYKYQPNGTRFFDGDSTVAADPEPTTLSIVAGNNQSVFPADTIETPFKVLVSDQFGDPIDLITVMFQEQQIPVGASVGSFFTPDGILLNIASTFDGEATMSYQLGSKPGSYHIKAFLPDFAEVDSIVFTVQGLELAPPTGLTAASGAGYISLNWQKAPGAVAYNVYRSLGDDNPASASLLTITEDSSFTDVLVTPSDSYFYWVSSLDGQLNESENRTGPVFAQPNEVPDPIFGQATLVAVAGDGFSKQWQYFDFSQGFASTQADTGNYLADIRGTSNEGVNFGNELAPQIEGRRIMRLDDGQLEEVQSLPLWTNQEPWISVSWEWANGTGGQPVEAGQLWGVYTREGNYAVMEITDVPEPFGDSLVFRYKYQTGGTPIFNDGGANTEPDTMIVISGEDQTAQPGTLLETPIAVYIADELGEGLQGVTVSFSISKKPEESSGAMLSATSMITNEDGVAFTYLTLGDVAGEYEVTASANGVDNVTISSSAVAAGKPEAVTLLTLMDRSDEALAPLWTQSEADDFLRYRIYISEDSTNFTLADSTRRDGFTVDTAYTVSGLETLKDYYFAVSVVTTSLQESAFSNVISGFPKPRPTTPAQVTATAGDGAVQLNWQPNDSSYFDFYYVYSGIDAGQIFPNDTLWSATDTSIVISGLENDAAYQFYVLAVNRFGIESNFPMKTVATPQSSYQQTQTSLPNLVNGVSSWGDVDNDGDLDLLMTGQIEEGGEAVSALFLNDGNGAFTESDQSIIGVYNSSVFWFDVDQNGFIDVILSGESDNGAVTKVYLNNEGTLTDAGFTLPGFGDGIVAPADFDNDGDLDFLLAGDDGSTPQTVLIENRGNGNFLPVNTFFTGVKKATATWGDSNGNGRLDVFISGETADGTIQASLYINDGDGLFHLSEAQFQGVINGTVAFTDIDLDARLDLFITGFTNAAQTELFSAVYKNTGLGFDLLFSQSSGKEKSKAVAQAKSRAVIGDYDNDGDADILVSTNVRASILKNNRGELTEQVLDLAESASVTWADYDGDGDLDIIATGGENAIILSNGTSIKNTAPSLPANPFAEVSGDTVRISWQPAHDAQTPTIALSYNVSIGTASGASDVLSANANLNTGKLFVLNGGNAGNSTELVQRDLPNGTYYWQVQAIDNSFLGSGFTPEMQFEITQSLVANEQLTDFPKQVELHQNYPNPFNPSTKISYQIPVDSKVHLSVYNLLGREVAILINARQTAGNYTVNFEGAGLASGIYIYRLQVGESTFVKKMTLIK